MQPSCRWDFKRYHNLCLNNAIHLFSVDLSDWAPFCVWDLRDNNSCALNASMNIPPGTRSPATTIKIVCKHFISMLPCYPLLAAALIRLPQHPTDKIRRRSRNTIKRKPFGTQFHIIIRITFKRKDNWANNQFSPRKVPNIVGQIPVVDRHGYSMNEASDVF